MLGRILVPGQMLVPGQLSGVWCRRLKAFAAAHLDPRSGSGMTWCGGVIRNAPVPSPNTFPIRHPQRYQPVILNSIEDPEPSNFAAGTVTYNKGLCV